MESRRLRMQATPRGGNTTPRRRLPAFVVEFNKAIVLLLLTDGELLEITEHTEELIRGSVSNPSEPPS